MDVTQIPYNKLIKVGVSPENDQALTLPFSENLKNHLGTFHAGAQFSLAEACSGLALQKQFPQLEGKVAGILRKTETKYKNPAQSDITATANIDEEMKEKFEKQFERKGRATITVSVEIRDANGNVTMIGEYQWFVQKI